MKAPRQQETLGKRAGRQIIGVGCRIHAAKGNGQLKPEETAVTTVHGRMLPAWLAALSVRLIRKLKEGISEFRTLIAGSSAQR